MLKPLLECAATYLHVSLLFCVPQPGKHRINGQREFTVRLRFFQLEVYSGESKGTTRPLPNPAREKAKGQQDLYPTPQPVLKRQPCSLNQVKLLFKRVSEAHRSVGCRLGGFSWLKNACENTRLGDSLAGGPKQGVNGAHTKNLVLLFLQALLPFGLGIQQQLI